MTTAQTSINRLSFEKIFYYPDYLKDLVKGKDTYPVHLQLGTVNYCNHDCTFCYAARSMFDAQEVPRTRINVPRMFEVVEDMVSHGLRSATLIGSGEPTLHPEIATIIRGLKERGLDVGMFTNGSCVTDATADAIAECMTFVRFSFTGASKKVHDLVHANSDFDRVVENIRKIAARRKGQLPTLGSQFVLASYSAEDVVAGAELAKDMGLDYYEIKPAYVAPDKPNQLENTLSISEANAFMEEARRLEDDNFKVYAKAQQLEGVFNGQDDRPYNNCPGHQTNAVLEADLNLYFCSNHKTPDFCIGSVDKESFEDVWNGPRRREIIQSLNVHSCEPHCRMDPLNKIVHSIRVGGREIPMNLPKPDEQLHVKFL